LLDAVSRNTRALGMCDGQRPWLGPHSRETCTENRRLLIRTASNAYFPELMSAISLPDEDQGLKAAIDRWWSDLENVSDIADLPSARKFNRGLAANLDGYSDEDVMAAVVRHKSGGIAHDEESIKPAEFDVMACGKARLGRDDAESSFFMETLDPGIWQSGPNWLLKPIQRVVIVRRLREVIAQSGFTRFDALAPDEDGELDIGVARASLHAR
jgi:hypothetical protein